MEWYQYFSGFWAGAFFANFVPHFVKGVCGEKFRTPFADPPGKGLSSPMVNVLWALINLIVGYLLFKMANASSENIFSLILFFIGITCMSLWLSKPRTPKEKI